MTGAGENVTEKVAALRQEAAMLTRMATENEAKAESYRQHAAANEAKALAIEADTIRRGRFILDVPDLNDPAAPGVRSYGSDPAYYEKLLTCWSGFTARWEDADAGVIGQRSDERTWWFLGRVSDAGGVPHDG